jgi:hypothetical protein
MPRARMARIDELTLTAISAGVQINGALTVKRARSLKYLQYQRG